MDFGLWTIVIGALLLRIVYNLALHSDGHPLSGFVIDEREYFGAAHVLAEGRGFTFFDTALWVRPPLYVLFLTLPLGIFGSNTVPIMLAQSVLSALTLLPLAWLGGHVGGRRAARMSVLLGALYLPFTLFAGLLLSETLFVFLFCVSLAVLVKAQEALAASGLRQALRWAGLAGGMLGLCILTRSTALGFVPLVGLWLFFSPARNAAVHKRLAAIGVMVLICGLALLPWIVRNYRAYGQFVMVDTTSGYNLWLGSVGVRDEERMQTDLRTLPNPVARQQFAYDRAFENISHDPAGFVGKGLKESFDLWRPLFSAEERQVSGYTLGRVPGWHLYALLVFDDLLYLAILLLAVWGLFFGPAHPLRSLTVLWVLLWVVMSFIFFAVTRFRLPVVAALIPWAGVGMSSIAPVRGLPGKVRRTAMGARMSALAFAVAIVVLVVPAIQISEVRLGAERWAQQEPYRLAEVGMSSHHPDFDRTIAWYRQANQNLADTRYGLAAALLQRDHSPSALSVLHADEPSDRFEPFILRGEAARYTGDLNTARSYFNARIVKVAGEKAVQWAWDHLDPPVTNTLEIGSGLDLGYIRGFYGPESDTKGEIYRWTTPDVELRNVQLTSEAGHTLQLTWSGWRPGGVSPAQVHFTWKTRPPEVVSLLVDSTVPNDLDWGSIVVPDTALGGSMRLYVNPFVPGGSDPRLLGVRVSKVEPRR